MAIRPKIIASLTCMLAYAKKYKGTYHFKCLSIAMLHKMFVGCGSMFQMNNTFCFVELYKIVLTKKSFSLLKERKKLCKFS